MTNKNLKYTRNYQDTLLDYDGKLELSSHLYLDNEKYDISQYTNMTIDEVTQLKQESIAAENAIFDIMQQYLSVWEEQAEKSMLLNQVLEYLKYPEIQHTNNEWRQNENYHYISNKVYSMNYRIYEYTKYDKETKEFIITGYKVNWYVYVRKADGRNAEKIAGQSNKTYTNKTAMEKYIKGRIKAYSSYFTEICPPLPPQYADYFKVAGKLLPGYTIEKGE